MEIKVYKDKKTETKNIVFLNLEETHDGVTVFVSDEKGNKLPSGKLVSFLNTGIFVRHRYIDPNLGFQLDDDQRIVVESI